MLRFFLSISAVIAFCVLIVVSFNRPQRFEVATPSIRELSVPRAQVEAQSEPERSARLEEETGVAFLAASLGGFGPPIGYEFYRIDGVARVCESRRSIGANEVGNVIRVSLPKAGRYELVTRWGSTGRAAIYRLEFDHPRRAGGVLICPPGESFLSVETRLQSGADAWTDEGLLGEFGYVPWSTVEVAGTSGNTGVLSVQYPLNQVFRVPVVRGHTVDVKVGDPSVSVDGIPYGDVNAVVQERVRVNEALSGKLVLLIPQRREQSVHTILLRNGTGTQVSGHMWALYSVVNGSKIAYGRVDPSSHSDGSLRVDAEVESGEYLFVAWRGAAWSVEGETAAVVRVVHSKSSVLSIGNLEEAVDAGIVVTRNDQGAGVEGWIGEFQVVGVNGTRINDGPILRSTRANRLGHCVLKGGLPGMWVRERGTGSEFLLAKDEQLVLSVEG